MVSSKVALVGAIDSHAAEFAMAPDGYADDPTTFSDGVALTIGADDPASDWSYIQPGPRDPWARGASRTAPLRFELDNAPKNALAVTAWVFDTHQKTPPSVDVSLNGHSPTTVDLPPGGGDGHRAGGGQGGSDGDTQPSLLDVDLPAGQLEAGENTISLTNASGSWLVYDPIGIRAVP